MFSSLQMRALLSFATKRMGLGDLIILMKQARHRSQSTAWLHLPLEALTKTQIYIRRE